MTGRRRRREPGRWWRRRDTEQPPAPEVIAARAERVRAEARLAEAQRLAVEGAATMRTLRNIDRRNHFADIIAAAFGEHR